jgi:hypothetical protein
MNQTPNGKSRPKAAEVMIISPNSHNELRAGTEYHVRRQACGLESISGLITPNQRERNPENGLV